MTRFAFLLAAAVCVLPVSPAAAQDEDGRGLIDRGARMFLDGLRQELDPAMRDLRDFFQDTGPSMRSFVQEMGPALRSMMDEVKDWSVYEAPEMLPNGDIVMRRKGPIDGTDLSDTMPRTRPEDRPQLRPAPLPYPDPGMEPRERRGLPPLDGNRIDL